MPQYMMVYKGEATDVADMSEEEAGAVMAKWGAWMEKVGPALSDAGTPFGPGTSLVDNGTDYAWSTHRIHSGLTCPIKALANLWSPSDWYRHLGDDPGAQAAAYRDWIEECRKRDEWDEVRRDPLSPLGGPPTRPNRSRAAC